MKRRVIDHMERTAEGMVAQYQLVTTRTVKEALDPDYLARYREYGLKLHDRITVIGGYKSAEPELAEVIVIGVDKYGVQVEKAKWV